MVTRVLSKFLIDQVQVAFDQADRRCADTANIRVLLQQHKLLEKSGRLVGEYLVAYGLQKSVFYLETLIERFRVCIGIHQDRLIEELQQHFI